MPPAQGSEAQPLAGGSESSGGQRHLQRDVLCGDGDGVGCEGLWGRVGLQQLVVDVLPLPGPAVGLTLLHLLLLHLLLLVLHLLLVVLLLRSARVVAGAFLALLLLLLLQRLLLLLLLLLLPRVS
jgi:hypothetical protein